MSPALRRRLVFAALYLSEGAPIGFLWWLLPARLSETGMSVERVGGLVASLALPWAFKFLWAPLLDAWRGRRAGYRAWMLSMQTVMALTLLPLGWLDLVDDFGLVYALCVLHAVAAATQDVAIDALAIAATPPEERGAVNGWMQGGMLLGRSIFGGLALRFAADVGLRPVVVTLAVVVVVVGLIAARSPLLREPEPSRFDVRRLVRTLFAPSMLRALLFAFVAGAGFEAVGGLVSPFLVGLGYAEKEIGTFLGLAAIACMVAGALMGGRVADRVGPRRAAAAFLVVLAVTVQLVALAPPGKPLFLALGGFYIAVGLFTAASYALFMNVALAGYGATQFTACMAMTNLCESWSIATASWLAGYFGLGIAFLVLAAISLAGLAVLPRPVCDTGTA